jgi:hypothetical protein
MGYPVREVINQRGSVSRGLETSVQSFVPERLEEDVNLLRFLLHLAHVKVVGSAQVDAPGAFDFVSSLGDYAELVRFRNGQGEAVLDLHKVKTPTLNKIQGLDYQGSTERLGGDGLIVADANHPNYQVVGLSNPVDPNPVAEVKQVLEKITNDETGATFLLAADGLYVIMRPAVERNTRYISSR